MSDDPNAQVAALPGRWTPTGMLEWELDTDSLGALWEQSVELRYDVAGVWHASTDLLMGATLVAVISRGKSARIALDRLASALADYGADLVEASHELLND